MKVQPYVYTWLRWVKFEQRNGTVESTRKVFEEALNFLGEDANDEKFFIAFAQFEERAKEVERARAVYKVGYFNPIFKQK